VWDDLETLLEAVDGGIDLSHLDHLVQRDIREDQNDFRIVIGTRRCGKTRFIAAESLEVADQFPGEVVPYVAPTVGRARDIIMPHFRKLQRDHGVQLTYNLGDHKIFTPNGGCVQLCGLATEAEVEKGRGGSSPALYIDECGAINQRLLQRAVRETYGPTTRDWIGRGGRGTLLSGTPDYVPGSYWNRLCGGNTRKSEFGATVHHMTIFDNPFYAGREDSTIDAFCRDNGLKRSDSIVLREWFGLFAVDSDGLAYPHWNQVVHPMHLMPLAGYTSLGVDLGSDHPCAWVVIRWVLTEHVDTVTNQVRYIHHGHVLETYEESGLQVPDVVAITREFQKAYSVGVTHGDSGGGGKMTIDTLAGTYGLDIQPVVKGNHKQDRIWMLDGMLANGTLHVHERCQTLVEQLGSVPKERKSNGLFDHMSGYADHSLDACHYAILAAKQHLREYDLGPKIGSREYSAKKVEAEYQRVTSNPSKRGAVLQRLATRRQRASRP
jgi:hypothetical protein